MPEILNSARPVWPSDYLFQLRKNKCFWYVTWLSLFIFCNAPPEVEIWLRTRVTEPGKTIQLRGKKKRKTSTTTVGIICHFFWWTHHHYIFHDFLVTGLKWSEICSSVFNTLLPHGPYSPWNSPGQNTGVGSLSLLKREPRSPALWADSLPTELSGKNLRQYFIHLCVHDSWCWASTEEVLSNYQSQFEYKCENLQPSQLHSNCTVRDALLSPTM